MNGKKGLRNFFRLDEQIHENFHESEPINNLDINKHSFSVSLQTFMFTTEKSSSDGEITFLFSWPCSLAPNFSSSRYAHVNRREGHRQQRRSGSKCYATFFSFSFISRRVCDVKFVFLVKWLEASRTVSSLNGPELSLMILENVLGNYSSEWHRDRLEGCVNQTNYRFSVDLQTSTPGDDYNYLNEFLRNEQRIKSISAPLIKTATIVLCFGGVPMVNVRDLRLFMRFDRGLAWRGNFKLRVFLFVSTLQN